MVEISNIIDTLGLKVGMECSSLELSMTSLRPTQVHPTRGATKRLCWILAQWHNFMSISARQNRLQQAIVYQCHNIAAKKKYETFSRARSNIILNDEDLLSLMGLEV